jgi:hypothetical protein
MHLPAEDFQALLRVRIEATEAKLRIEFEEEKKKQVEEELERMRRLEAHEAQVLQARKHIEEEILQVKCPRCRRAFHDFEGCFAISCSSCPCKICGWCLRDCGDQDAHPHVRQCSKKPQGVDALFPQMPNVRGAFENTKRQRSREQFEAFVKTLPDAIRERVRCSVQHHFA